MDDKVDCADCLTVDDVEDDASSFDEKLVYEGSARTDVLALSVSLTVDNLEPAPPRVALLRRIRLNMSKSISSSSTVI